MERKRKADSSPWKKPDSACSFTNKIMIILHIKGVNEISQEIYDNAIKILDLSLLTCPGCKHTGTTVHAYYDRRVRDDKESFRLIVQRVKCSFCEKTHALLPDLIVPYSSISLKNTIQVILSRSPEERKEIFDRTTIDWSDIHRIRRAYKQVWKERLISFGICIDEDLSRNCIRQFESQFMQIRYTPCGSYG